MREWNWKQESDNMDKSGNCMKLGSCVKKCELCMKQWVDVANSEQLWIAET